MKESKCGGSGEVEDEKPKKELCSCGFPQSHPIKHEHDRNPEDLQPKEKSLVGEEDEDASFCEGEDVGVEAERSRWIIKIESCIQELEAKKKSWIKESKKYKKIRCSDSFNLCVKRCDEADNRIDELRGLLEKKEVKK